MGLVVYVGASSKIMMNAKKSTPKQSSVEKTVNRLLASVLIFELFSVTCCTMGMYIEIHEVQKTARPPFLSIPLGFIPSLPSSFRLLWEQLPCTMAW